MTFKEWATRTFHLGPDHEDIERGAVLAEEAYAEIEALQQAKKETFPEFPLSGFIRRANENERQVDRALGVAQLPRIE